MALGGLADHAHRIDDFQREQVNLADWMRECPYVASLTVDQMVFPGTHHSGACDRNAVDFLKPVSPLTQLPWWQKLVKNNFESPIATDILRQSQLQSSSTDADNFADVIKAITLTQPSASVKQQLEDGVRYLDLRVACSADGEDTTYYVADEFVVSRLSDALDDVCGFLEEHTGEVLLVFVQPKANVASDDQLMDFIEKHRCPSGRTIGELMFAKSSANQSSGTFAQCGTIEDLVVSNQRLLLVYDSSPATPSKWFFQSECFFPGWQERCETVQGKQNFLRELLDDVYQPESNGKVFHLPYTLVSSDRDLGHAKSMADFSELIKSTTSLEQLTAAMNPTLQSFVLDSLPTADQNFINIFTLDYYHEHRQAAIQLVHNLLRLRHKGSAKVDLYVSTCCVQ